MEDSLKSISIFESGFVYSYDMDKIKGQLIPPHRMKLQEEDVLTVKNIIDSIIEEIVSIMKTRFKSLIDEFIMIEIQIPFWKLENGEIMIGKSVEL